MIKIFRGAGVVTPSNSNPLPPTNNFCLYPPPVFRYFWKDPLMTPQPPPPHFKHPSLQLPSPSTTPFPPPLKILIVHYSLSPGFWQFYFNRGLQRLYTSTCIILQKTINGFLCLLFVFLKSKTYQLILKDVIKLNRNLR